MSESWSHQRGEQQQREKTQLEVLVECDVHQMQVLSGRQIRARESPVEAQRPKPTLGTTGDRDCVCSTPPAS